MEDETITTSGNARAFGGVVGLIALITGIAAIVRPLQLQVESQSVKILHMENSMHEHLEDLGHPRAVLENLDRLRDRMNRHESLDGHPAIQSKASTMEVKIEQLQKRVTKLDGI